MAASKSTWPAEPREILESDKPASLVVDPCLLPKHESELDRELVLEFVLEVMENDRPRAGVAVSLMPSSLFDQIAEPNSVSMGERRVSLICCRPFALRSTYLDDVETGESMCNEGLGEFVFVFGLDNRFWLAVLWWFPISVQLNSSGGATTLKATRRRALIYYG